MFHLLVASTNQGKVEEIKQMLASNYLKVSSLLDIPGLAQLDVPESGATFADNALIKARTFGRLSGLTTLADDSGLEVAALDNRPGVLSKRYAADDSQRIQKLLNELEDVPAGQRQARFVCALVLFDPASDRHHLAQGIVEGEITTKPQGNHGFGYDPIFFCPQIGKTFGQAEESQKNQVSHRTKAMAQMQKIIRRRCR